jgi:hypothetical protein
LAWATRPHSRHQDHPPSGTDDAEAVMKFLFDEESFSFEALRTAGLRCTAGLIWASSSPPPATSGRATRPAGTGRGRPPRSGCKPPAKTPGLLGTGSAHGKPCSEHRTTTAPQRTSCSKASHRLGNEGAVRWPARQLGRCGRFVRHPGSGGVHPIRGHHVAGLLVPRRRLRGRAPHHHLQQRNRSSRKGRPQ